MESHALLVVVDRLVPFWVYQSNLFPPVKNRGPYLAIDPIIIEEEGLLGLDLPLKFLEVRKESLADELPVVDHFRIALACARNAVDATRMTSDAAAHACSPAPRIKSRGNPLQLLPQDRVGAL